MKVETKVKRLIKLREEILKEAKVWKKKKRWLKEKCPLDMDIELSHYELSMLLNGLGFYPWTCPFCGEAFSE